MQTLTLPSLPLVETTTDHISEATLSQDDATANLRGPKEDNQSRQCATNPKNFSGQSPPKRENIREGPQDEQQASRPIYVFSALRTASNLFMKMFSKHPQLIEIHYPHFDAHLAGPEQLFPIKLDDDYASPSYVEKDMATETYQVAHSRLKAELRDIKEDQSERRALCKDHVFTITKPSVLATYFPRVLPSPEDPRIESSSDTQIDNPTLLPTALLQSVTPVFLIRHPAFQIPSYLRVRRNAGWPIYTPDASLNISLQWSVLLYEWYEAHTEIAPIAIDANDLTSDPHAIMCALCERVGLDPQGVSYTWPQVPQNEIGKLCGHIRSFMNTMLTSDRIVPPVERKEAFRDEKKAGKGTSEACDDRGIALGTDDDEDHSRVDISAQKFGWIEEFGEDIADQILRDVRLEMELYETLRSKRLRIPVKHDFF